MDLCTCFSSIPLDLLKEASAFLVVNDHVPSCYKASDGSSVPWIIDSGASHHITYNSSDFTNSPARSSFPRRIQIADGSYVKVNQSGSIRTPSLSVPGVLHIPDFSVNLLSVSQLVDLGYEVVFSSSGCHVRDQRSKQIVGSGRRHGGVYVLVDLKIPSSNVSSNDLMINKDSGTSLILDQKMVVKVDLEDDKNKQKAMKLVSRLPGVKSISMNLKEKKLTVIGDIDAVTVVGKLRKEWYAEIITVGPNEEEKKKDEAKKKEENKEEEKKDPTPRNSHGLEEKKKKKKKKTVMADVETVGPNETGKKTDRLEKERAKRDEGKEDEKKDGRETVGAMSYYGLSHYTAYNPLTQQYYRAYTPQVAMHSYTTYPPHLPQQYAAVHEPQMSMYSYYYPSAEENPNSCVIS